MKTVYYYFEASVKSIKYDLIYYEHSLFLIVGLTSESTNLIYYENCLSLGMN